KYFGDRLAVGRHIGLSADPGTPTDIEIIGVGNDVRYDSLRSELAPQVYLCTLQQQRTTGVCPCGRQSAERPADHPDRRSRARSGVADFQFEDARAPSG